MTCDKCGEVLTAERSHFCQKGDLSSVLAPEACFRADGTVAFGSEKLWRCAKGHEFKTGGTILGPLRIVFGIEKLSTKAICEQCAAAFIDEHMGAEEVTA